MDYDLLIYTALSRFDERPRFSAFAPALQRDIKRPFSSYKKVCQEADELLLSVGNTEFVNTACSVSLVGKLTPDGLYVHESALDCLSPVLRVYEGCARGYIGRVEGANIIKLNRRELKITYLNYPDFEIDPHPALQRFLSVHLQTFRVKARAFGHFRNPPILHRKETFLQSGHPLHAKFGRLTRIEESKGLYDNPSHIGTRDGWDNILAEKGLRLHGHRVVRA